MRTLYDDGRYLVTEASFSTPTRLYPLTHATVRIRHDPFWIGVSASLVAWLALAAYGDLLLPIEIIYLACIPAVSLTLGLFISVLAIDAVGHTRVLIVGPRKKMRAVFNAIRVARTAELRDSSPPFSTEGHSGK